MIMRAIRLSNSRYELCEVEQPACAPGHVLIKVAYAGMNRADLFQVKGKYPLPEGGIPGLEISGEVVKGGARFKAGDPACAIINEGAFAEYVAVPEGQVMPLPQGVGMDEAACLPEACFTAWVSLARQAALQPGETVLVHGGASGVGVLAIQIARILGAQVFATAGTAEKCAAITSLGVRAINYNSDDFVNVVAQETRDEGVDVILDMVGGDYVQRNLACLARNGRLCIIAFLRGSLVNVNFSPILLKHLQVMGSTLRSRSPEEKTIIAQELVERVWPSVGQDKLIKPMIAKIFPLKEAEKALAFMDKSLNIGKILLRI